MKKLSLLTLIFALCSVVFFLLLIFFRTPFPLYPLMSVQDAFDLLTPLVLIPLYWLMFREGGSERSSKTGEVIFMILAGLWVLGHGMHLAANSINNLAEGLARKQVVDITATTIYELTYFLDEYLSHYIWHFSIWGFAALLVNREWKHPAGAITNWWLAIPAGMIYGFTKFCVFLEGNTVMMSLPFAVIFTLGTLIWGRKKLVSQPILAFFFIAFLVTTLFFIGWGLYFGGFPPFSEVGLI